MRAGPLPAEAGWPITEPAQEAWAPARPGAAGTWRRAQEACSRIQSGDPGACTAGPELPGAGCRVGEHQRRGRDNDNSCAGEPANGHYLLFQVWLKKRFRLVAANLLALSR